MATAGYLAVINSSKLLETYAHMCVPSCVITTTTTRVIIEYFSAAYSIAIGHSISICLRATQHTMCDILISSAFICRGKIKLEFPCLQCGHWCPRQHNSDMFCVNKTHRLCFCHFCVSASKYSKFSNNGKRKLIAKSLVVGVQLIQINLFFIFSCFCQVDLWMRITNK